MCLGGRDNSVLRHCWRGMEFCHNIPGLRVWAFPEHGSGGKAFKADVQELDACQNQNFISRELQFADHVGSCVSSRKRR